MVKENGRGHAVQRRSHGSCKKMAYSYSNILYEMAFLALLCNDWNFTKIGFESQGILGKQVSGNPTSCHAQVEVRGYRSEPLNEASNLVENGTDTNLFMFKSVKIIDISFFGTGII